MLPEPIAAAWTFVKENSVYVNMMLIFVSFVVLLFPVILPDRVLEAIPGVIGFRGEYFNVVFVIFLLSFVLLGAELIKRGNDKAKKREADRKRRELDAARRDILSILYNQRDDAYGTREEYLRWSNRVFMFLDWHPRQSEFRVNMGMHDPDNSALLGDKYLQQNIALLENTIFELGGKIAIVDNGKRVAIGPDGKKVPPEME